MDNRNHRGSTTGPTINALLSISSDQSWMGNFFIIFGHHFSPEAALVLKTWAIINAFIIPNYMGDSIDPKIWNPHETQPCV